MASLGSLLGTVGGGAAGFAISGGNPAGAMLGASLGGTLFGDKGKPTTIAQGPLETPEQAAARKMMLERARQDPSYKGPLGDFNMTGAETAGQGRLMALLNGGTPGIVNKGLDTLDSYLSGAPFDPNDPSFGFGAFKEQNALDTADAAGNLKRHAAFAGNLYSTNTIQDLGRVESQGNLNLQNKLGEMYQNYVNNRLSAVPIALQAGQTLQGMDLNAINAASTYGALPRQLSTAADQAAYGEFTRSQGVTDSLLSSVAGGPPQFGPSSYTLPAGPTPWSNVLDTLAYSGGMMLGRGDSALGTTKTTPTPGTGGTPPYLLPNDLYHGAGYSPAGGF